MEKKYVVKDFSGLKGLSGISDPQLAEHQKLYAGYVNRTNALTERLMAFCSEGKATGTDPAYAEMTRRLGFEYNGMILHEYYFANLKAGAAEAPGKDSNLYKAIERSFGSYQNWLADFRGIAGMPGIGWVATYQDPTTGWLSNHWITLHNDGNPAGFRVVLAMDVWEHAFMRDYQAFERGKYVDAFFKNVDWDVANSRLK